MDASDATDASDGATDADATEDADAPDAIDAPDATDACAAAELCDGVDNDCDPATLDGADDPSMGEACGDPATCTEGTLRCRAGMLMCEPQVLTERCDGADQDCDGRIDEDLVDPRMGISCCGGETICRGGAIVCDVPPVASSIERCDAVDNDCDGLIDEGVCPCDTIRRPGATYHVCANDTEWGPAAVECAGRGYLLATVNDAAEQEFLADAIAARGERRFFIGLRRESGALRWHGGSPVVFTAWQPGEPASSTDCAAMRRAAGGAWEMHRCGNNIGHICETNALPWSPPE